MDEGKQIPESILRVFETLKRYHTEESFINGFNFKPGRSDVIISTAPKAGTTVVQQICHGLRSGGNMDFKEISLVVPCLEMAQDYGYKDLHALQPYQPQMFKTHFWYHYTPKGAVKYITVVRKPADIALSLFHFCDDWYFKKGEVSLEDWLECMIRGGGAPKSPRQGCSPMHHIMSWYPHRFDKNVLWLHYEDINQNRRECVRLIAEFLDIGAHDEALQELITKQSSFEFMKEHSTKYDEHPLKLARNEAAGLPRDAGLTGNPGKVRTGISNAGKDALPQSVMDLIDSKWNKVVTTATGYETYEEFRSGINKELNRNFE